MTQIEELVRQALSTTPVPTAAIDPFDALEGRIRRARRRLAAAAGIGLAVVVAAVVVPLAALGGNNASDKIGVVTPPTPAPSALPGTTVLWQDGAIWASTDSDGRRWMLTTSNGDMFVSQVGDGQVHEGYKVESPADYVVAGDTVVWVVGGGDGGDNVSRVTAINTDTGDVATLPFPATLLSYATAVGNSLYVTADPDSRDAAVDRVDLVNGAVTVADSHPVPSGEEMVATGIRHIWIHADKKLVELVPNSTGFEVGKTVEWGNGVVLAQGRGDGVVWADDGRLIQLSPAMLANCLSCAEGDRISTSGRPRAVVEGPGAELYVATGNDELDYYTAADRGAGDGRTTASLHGVHVITMIADAAGGIDYIDDQGQLVRWDPAAA